ncbi:endosome-associated-trafficking regulator 1-like isoform X2 [Haliotis rubra]|uniref:endosome-associated-trafficking regulator 1-like isoform X2 n=1 Tax=Haliotis rubra TaxID=36100 RepID=UPI001EE57AA2|nr:endosome-associated-trafficking regulator 1-like isoform X2 [Haliotis rubra]
MAEGGGEDSENPFSFKKFVKKKDQTYSLSDEDKDKDDTEDMFLLPDVSALKKKGKAALIFEDEPQAAPTKKSSDENPFSFKKFLSGPQTSARPKSGASPRSRNNAPDFASDLPDFVQDHFLDESQIKKERIARNPDLDLPDFALTSNIEENVSASGQNSGDLPDIGGSGIENGDHHSDNSDEESTRNRPTMPSSISSLPDFLSDGAVNNTELFNGHSGGGTEASVHSTQRGVRDVSSLEVHGDLELENRRLREENQKLKTIVEDTKKLAVKESERVSELLKQMERQQKKEAEETAVMERAVQQVEANLVTTTQRAVKAENTVAKLRQEVKTLQNKISALQTDRDSSNAEDGLSAILERTKYSSDQLASAADTGEQAIKQLMTGVDKLRLLSQVLASIDKITDVPDEENAESAQSSHNT